MDDYYRIAALHLFLAMVSRVNSPVNKRPMPFHCKLDFYHEAKVEMKKTRILLFVSALLCASVLLNYGTVQAVEKNWSDGDPSFTQTLISGGGLTMNSTITLEPQLATSATADSLSVMLHGLLWSWPRATVEVVSAKDIDYRQVANQELYLITDALANRIFEYNATEKREVWTFGSNRPGTPSYLDRPVDAYIYKESDLFKILITDQGRNRVLKIDKESQSVTWFYGDPNGAPGSETGRLNSPTDAQKIPDRAEILIADTGNNRVLIVDENSKAIIWEFGTGELASPVDVEYVPELDAVLIADQSQHRVILVQRSDKTVIRQFGVKGVPASGSAGLNAPTDADYLSNGNILIADTNNERLIEVNAAGEIVWQFHRPLAALQDADRLPDNRHLIINDIFPTMIGYADSLIVLPEMDLGDDQKVIFDRIYWTADHIAGQTDVHLQMRSGNSLSALRDSPWYGPNGANTYYTFSGQQLNAIHFGHSLYQIRAYLQTDDPLQTPILQNVAVEYHYFNTKTTSVFRSPRLPQTTGSYTNNWRKMILHTRLPNDPALRTEIGLDFLIRHADTDQILASFSASSQLTETVMILDNYPQLVRASAIYLEGRATTNLPFVTPILEDWSIIWDEIESSTSALRFVNSAGSEVDFYRATTTLPAQESRVDSVRILFSDPDVAAFQNTLNLDLFAKLSGDSLNIQLELNAGTGFFANRAMPILVSDKVDKKNGILEVLDRDTLTVSYVDDDDPSDISSDRVLVIKNSTGEMLIENRRAAQLTTIQPGDTLFVRIKNERDRNISPIVQEQIRVAVYDNTTGDREDLTLLETPNGLGKWDSNEFYVQSGLPVVLANNGLRNDGKLQSLRGHRITVEYADNVTLIQTVLIPSDPDIPGTVTIDFGGEPFIVEIAPNPFYEQKHSWLKMRVAAAFGSINVSYMEIFNLAGEKVRHIDESELAFDQTFPVPKDIYAKADNWWDLRNDNGDPVASGTYFLKVHAVISNDDTNTRESKAFIRKFVVVR